MYNYTEHIGLPTAPPAVCSVFCRHTLKSTDQTAGDGGF